jgi:RimJ/RimL family protein N-acetyltransferase
VPELPYPHPPLRDGDVVLRPYRDSDMAALIAALQDPEIPRWTDIPSPYGRAEARAFLDGRDLERRAGRALALAVVDAEDDSLIGGVGLTRFDSLGRAEIGYWIDASARGRTVGTRAVRALARWAVRELGVLRLELYANPANEASQRLAESAGFTREGMLRSLRPRKGVREDLVVFSLLPEDLRE